MVFLVMYIDAILFCLNFQDKSGGQKPPLLKETF